MKKLYFCRVLILSIFYLFELQAQQVISPAPGGVQGVEAWFKTEPKEGSTTEYHWKDYGGDEVKLNTYNSTEFFNIYDKEDLSKNEIRFFNFNPALQLGYLKTGQENSYREFTLNCTNLSQMMIFGAFAPIGTTFEAEKHLYTINGKPKEGISFTTDKVIESVESGKTPLDYGEEEGEDLMHTDTTSESDYREGAMRLATYYRMNQPNYSIWGEKQQANVSLGDIFNSNNTHNTSTFDENEFINRKFSGYIPEFIVYSRYLNPLERRRVESYLALKYGLTIDQSYLKSNGDLIWDLAANPVFNNRITAVIKDDASALDQFISTTTYEEAPTFSDAHDSYFQTDHTKGSSNKRLLTIESSGLKDGEYAIWGDNNDNLSVQESDEITNLKMMNRDWYLKTNRKILGEIDADWKDKKYFQITEEGSRIKALSTSKTLITSDQFEDAMIEWTVTSNRQSIVVGLGDDTNRSPITHSIWARENQVFYKKHIRDCCSGIRLGTYLPGDRFKIERKGGKAYYYKNDELVYSEESTDELLYSKIYMWKPGSEIYDYKMESKRGDQVELSYDENKATIFNNLTNNADDNPDNDADQVPYLIIDRSGRGTYQTQNTEIFKYTSIDTERKKIIFDNVFWDTDESGDDVFTFGQKESNLIAIIEGENPTCEDYGKTVSLEWEILNGKPSHMGFVITDYLPWTGFLRHSSGKDMMYAFEYGYHNVLGIKSSHVGSGSGGFGNYIIKNLTTDLGINYKAGDRFKIQINEGRVYYYYNDTLVYNHKETFVSEKKKSIMPFFRASNNSRQIVDKVKINGGTDFKWMANDDFFTITNNERIEIKEKPLNGFYNAAYTEHPILGDTSGTIKIEVKEGEPLFRYTITDKAESANTWTGKFGDVYEVYNEIPFEYANLKNVEYDAEQDEVGILNRAYPWGSTGFSSKDPIEGDFELSWNSSQNNRIMYIGLSETPKNGNYTIDYALNFTQGKQVIVSEKGRADTSASVSDIMTSDSFKIKKEGTTISYFRNNELIKESSTPSNTSLYIDGSFFGYAPIGVKNIKINKKENIQNMGDEYFVSIPNIPPGTYTVKVEEIRKTNFTNEGTSMLSNRLQESEGYLEYQVKDINSNTKRLGFVTNLSNTVEYGIQQKGDSIYYQVNGEITERYPINLEDVIRVKKMSTDLVYEVNDEEIHRITGVLTSSNFYAKVEIDTSGSFKNVDHKGFALASWIIQNGTIEIEELTTGNTATEEITITAPECDHDRDDDGIDDERDNCPDTPNSDQLDTDGDGLGDVCDPEPNGDNNVDVYPVPSTSGEPFTVKVDLDDPSEIVILVYDMKGRLITEKYVKEQKDLHEVQLILNQIGVYIIKVLSKEGEFTNKITID
ncbi:thrombospondin-1 [Flavobacteriaceae bacterium UJ101]|nr:thrombospondin-1 [Flavobacteriaceae bacterium UJ101]